MLQGASGGDLWAKAVELERQFAGYNQRLAERRAAADAYGGVGPGGEVEEAEGEVGGGDVRGRMYEAYTRRRAERLREGWRARMERKEAEMKALWARLESAARAGGRAGERGPAGPGAWAAREQKTENFEEKRSFGATPATSIGAKNHSRARSFSSPTATSSPKTWIPEASRRALSQEPPRSESRAAASDLRKENRVPPPWPSTAAPAPRPKAVPRNRSSATEHGSLKAGALKPPRSQPPRTSSGGAGDLKEPVLSNTNAAAPVQSSSGEQAVLKPSLDRGSGIGPDAGAAKPRATSVDCGETVNIGGNAYIDKGSDEEIAGDSETEPSCVYIEDGDEETVRSSETLGGSDTEPKPNHKKKDSAKEITAASSDTPATESAATSVDESLHSSTSNVSAPDSPLDSPPSCGSQPIEQLLEADAAWLRKRREASAERDAVTPITPSSRISSAAQSPKDAARGFKRLLSFGKKKKNGREVTVTVTDCASPSVASLADDDSSTSGRCPSSDSIKPRMSSLEDSYVISQHVCSLQSLVPASPASSELNEIVTPTKSLKGHRSFFPFPSFKCGRS